MMIKATLAAPSLIIALVLAATLHAQAPQSPVVSVAPGVAQEAAREAGFVTRTLHLSSSSSQAEQNETLTALRNIASANLRVILVPSQNAIVVRGTPDQVQQAADLLRELDHPHRQYRLTYTLTETEGGKPVGVQRYSMVLAVGERMQLKEGSRIPVFTGSYTKADQAIEKQTTYLDIGLNFDSLIQEYDKGVMLRSKVEQSAVVTEKSGVGPEDPIIRQTRLEGTSYLTESKSLALGTLDVLGSTRKLEVQAEVEAIH